MAETAAERRARVAAELAELEHEDQAAKPKRSAADQELRERALRGDLPLPGIERRPHLELHERFARQWPTPESASVPHEPHSEVTEHEARRWPTAHRESN